MNSKMTNVTAMNTVIGTLVNTMEPLFNENSRVRDLRPLSAEVFFFKARNFCPYHGDFSCVLNSKGLLREVPVYTGL